MKRLREKIYDIHDIACNQKYNNTLPYSFHLQMVEAQADKFWYLVPEDDLTQKATRGAVMGHDLIEDARTSYNDIASIPYWYFTEEEPDRMGYAKTSSTNVGKRMADIVYACTEEKGKNRSDRHNDKFWVDLMGDSQAVFVKLCDLIANVKFSLLTNSSMFDKYKKEWPRIKQFLTEYGVTITSEGSPSISLANTYDTIYKDMIIHIENLFKC